MKKTLKCYKITMMSGSVLKIDEDELGKVASAVQSGHPCWVRQGLFNPKSYSDILLDNERMRTYQRGLYETEKHNRFQQDYVEPEKRYLQELPKFEKLPNIFEGVDITGQLQKLKEQPKRLE